MGSKTKQIITATKNLFLIVIPGLTRNPVFSWIPAFAGMTCFAAIHDVVYRFVAMALTHSSIIPFFHYSSFTIPLFHSYFPFPR